MTTYEETMEIIKGSKRYEFHETELIMTGYYTGKKARLDLDQMTEEIFEELATDDHTDYKDAVRIIRGSKAYEFEETRLTITGYYTGTSVTLDLGNMTDEMYEKLQTEEDLDEDFDEDFADAINGMEEDQNDDLTI